MGAPRLEPGTPLANPPILSTGERHSGMLKFDHRGDGLPAHVLDGILVAEPIGALDGVVDVPLPNILAEMPRLAAIPPCAATV